MRPIQLVVRVQSALAESSDAGEDPVGGFGSDRRFGIQVGLLNVGLNRSFEAIGADPSTA